MIEMSISSELAAAHPGLVAECLERGHRVEVFESGETPREASGTRQPSTTTLEIAAEDRPLWPGSLGRR